MFREFTVFVLVKGKMKKKMKKKVSVPFVFCAKKCLKIGWVLRVHRMFSEMIQEFRRVDGASELYSFIVVVVGLI